MQPEAAAACRCRGPTNGCSRATASAGAAERVGPIALGARVEPVLILNGLDYGERRRRGPGAEAGKPDDVDER